MTTGPSDHGRVAEGTMPGSPVPASAVPFVLAIDVEPDGRPARPGSGLPLDEPYFACAIRSDTIGRHADRIEQVLGALVRRSLAGRSASTDGHGALEALGLLAPERAPLTVP